MLIDLLIIGFVGLALYGLYSWLTETDSPERMLGRHIHRLREQAKGRAPVLYLRSFSGQGLRLADIKSAFVGKTIPGTEAHWKDAGHWILSVLDVIGPPVELASPAGASGLQPWSPSRPRAERVANEDWQKQVLALLPRAALVVVQLDASPGLAWEMEQLVHRVSPTRILLVLPSTEADYGRLLASTAGWFPRPLPRRLPDSRLMAFRANWEPLALEAKGAPGGVWHTLEPVFQRNGYEAPDWRRAYKIGEHSVSSKGSARG